MSKRTSKHHGQRILRIDTSTGSIEVSVDRDRCAVRYIPLGGRFVQNILLKADQLREVADALLQADLIMHHEAGDDG